MAKTAEAMRPDTKLDPVFARALREALFWLLAALALVLFIAPIVLLDLRLLGRAKHFELVPVSDLLTRWAVSGFFLLALAGILMFSADAGPLSVNRVMQLKALGIALGVVNCDLHA